MSAHILIVEDDLKVVDGLLRGLRAAGFETSLAMSADEGTRLMLSESFDLVVLDLMLPERNGLEVLEHVRSRVSVPILVLSARTDLQSRLASFQRGAVDFVPKPFFIEELVARIRSRLVLDARPAKREVNLEDVVLDLDARVARRDGQDLGLTTHEYNIVAYLCDRIGRALTRAQIAEYALPEDGSRSDRTVDSHVSRIRKKLGGRAGGRIRTVWGIGYRLTEGDL